MCWSSKNSKASLALCFEFWIFLFLQSPFSFLVNILCRLFLQTLALLAAAPFLAFPGAWKKIVVLSQTLFFFQLNIYLENDEIVPDASLLDYWVQTTRHTCWIHLQALLRLLTATFYLGTKNQYLISFFFKRINIYLKHDRLVCKLLPNSSTFAFKRRCKSRNKNNSCFLLCWLFTFWLPTPKFD